MRTEWTKLRTLPSTPWLLLAVAVSTAGLGAAAAATMDPRDSLAGAVDTIKMSLTGVWLGQLIVVVFAVLALGNEYGTRMIQTTLTANPHRLQVFASKVLVVLATALCAAGAGVAGSYWAAWNILPRTGLDDPGVWRATGGSVLYLGLIALLSIGVAAIVRDTAGALSTVMAMLLLPQILGSIVSNPLWEHRIQKFSPMSAGLSIQATRDLAALPVQPWTGLGILAAYAVAALIVGALTFRIRDA